MSIKHRTLVPVQDFLCFLEHRALVSAQDSYIIIRILTEFFGKEPRRTMNASECVARGCALQCAILSPTFKVREFQVNESFPFSIALSWMGSVPESQNGSTDQPQSTVVFPKGNILPSTNNLTIYRSSTFTVDVVYADMGGLDVPAKISTYRIGPFQSKGECAKLKLQVRLNLHGIVSVESATLMEEDVEVTVAKEPAKMDTEENPSVAVPAEASEGDVNMEDAKSDGVTSGAEPVQMDTNTKGYLDEQFVQLEDLQDDDNPNFVEDIVKSFFQDSVRSMNNIEKFYGELPF